MGIPTPYKKNTRISLKAIISLNIKGVSARISILNRDIFNCQLLRQLLKAVISAFSD